MTADDAGGVSLRGRRALVTGGARNLGAELCRRLALAGASVAVNVRTSLDDAEALVAELPGPGRHAVAPGDVSRPDEVVSLVATAAERLGGPIDVLVHNAGPYTATPFVDLPPSQFDRVWETNAKAAYLLARAVAPGMRDVGGGRIVNVSASSAYVRNRSVYTLANAAIITLTEQLAAELAPEIVVNAVAPGQIHESLEELRELVPDWADEVVRRTPLGRLATRREIADVVVLLSGPAFAGVVGATIEIDGGLRLRVG